MARTISCAVFLLVAALLAGCNHATKGAAKALLSERGPLELVPGIFDLRYAENHDTAFSLTRSWAYADKTFVLGLVAAAVVVLACALWWRQRGGPATLHAGFAFVVGGALGNVIDRLYRGYVVDFLHIHHWPIFNVADVAVGVGAGLLVLASWRAGPRERARA